jgi:hypothetical protein
MKLSDDEAQIVPFGKYRDQPIESLLADRGYVEWLMNQPGLVAMLQAKYPAVYNIITIGAPASDDTPEHNKLQAMFLNRDFQYAFIEAVLGKSVYAVAQEAAGWADKKNRAALEEALKHSPELIKKRQEDKTSPEAHFKDAQLKAAKPLSEWQREYDAKVNEIELDYYHKMHGGGDPFAHGDPERERAQRLGWLEWDQPEKRIEEAQEKLIRCKERFREACQKLTDEETRFAQLNSQLDGFKNATPCRPDVQVEFECGFDVKLTAAWVVECITCHVTDAYSHEFSIHTWRKAYENDFTDRRTSRFGRRIELKPIMGEDFPSVLRQMKRNGANTLVIGEFESKSCTLAQVRGMFGAEKQIITLAEIQAIQARGGWPDDNDATADRTRS